MKIKRKLENKNLRLYIGVYIVLGILLIIAIALIVLLFRSLLSGYQDTLQECVSRGYDITYCKSILN